MRYFTKITATWKASKERKLLHKEILNMADKWNQQILDRDNINSMIQEIKEELLQLHRLYPNTRPYHMTYWFPTSDPDTHLIIYMIDAFALSIFKEKTIA